MKRCPECSKTFPDSERFCSSDGAALVPEESAQRVTTQMPPTAAAEPAVECPVCGGKALPGEELCSFCGARLNVADISPPPEPNFTIPKQTVLQMPPEQASGAGNFDEGLFEAQQPSGARRFFAWTGYLVAAIVALTAGAWFALHLNGIGLGHKTEAPAVSPVAAPASPAPATGLIAALATNTPVQVTGESASDPARNLEAASKVFNDNSAAVLDNYKKALESDSSFSDGVLATLTINPGGDVVAGSVKTSTSSNPALDGELVKTMMGWHFTPFSGSSVEVSYPVVMAHNSDERASVESALSDKIAHLSPDETPEYASAPPAAAPAAAMPASPAAAPSPELAAREPITPPGMAPEAPPPPAIAPEAPPAPAPAPEYVRPRRHHRVAIPPPPPRVSLLDRVLERLRSDRRLGRVRAYTNGGGVVVIYGKVFENKDRRLAVSTVRSVDGVTDVIDNLQTDTDTWRQQQAAIAAQLQGAGLNQVTVKVIGHDAYLDGQVSTELEKERAVTIAESAAPVRVRTNLIRVVPKGVFSSF
jgi:predicted nucleic acid-binding Zn ribbon protein